MSFLTGLRFPIAIAIGLLLNSTLFWALYSLTNVAFEIDTIEARQIEFTRMRQDSATETLREIEVELERPPVVPETPSINVSDSGVDGNLVTLAPTIDVGGATTGMSLSAGNDRDVIPLVRINPDYPPRALSRGIEGWVQVQFTISETGSVIDATVVDSSPKNVFDDAAIKAITRWRYNPKVEGAVAVQRKGVQTILRFQLEDE
ncbi:MAG: energy transducer TonB [Pseudohongiellaceae bacterium]